jgi:Ala-tRNA(Pro) deacylase
MRVPQFLIDRQIPFEILIHPPAFTAQKRAKYLGVSGRQVVKSVLLVSPRGPFLAVLPAIQRVDTQALERNLGGPIRLANPREIAAVFRDCEWGVLAPFGTLYGVPTVLEASFASDHRIVFEAHRHAAAIRMRCDDFERLERPQRVRFADA